MRFKIGDRVQMIGSPQFRGKILRITSDGFAQLNSNMRIALDQLEPQTRRKSSQPPLANWGDKRPAMMNSNGEYKSL